MRISQVRTGQVRSGLVKLIQTLSKFNQFFWQHIFETLGSNLEILTMIKILQTWNSSVALLSPTCFPVFLSKPSSFSESTLVHDVFNFCSQGWIKSNYKLIFSVKQSCKSLRFVQNFVLGLEQYTQLILLRTFNFKHVFKVLIEDKLD